MARRRRNANVPPTPRSSSSPSVVAAPMLASRQSKLPELTTCEPDEAGLVGEDARRVPEPFERAPPQTSRYAHGSSSPQRSGFDAGPFWPSECSVMSATWGPSAPHESAWAIGAAIATAAAAQAITDPRRERGLRTVTLSPFPAAEAAVDIPFAGS